MSKLEDDLKNYADDALNKHDAKAAIALLCEICGAGAILWAAALVISALFGPGVLAPAGAGACYYLLKRCGDVYADLPSDQRRLIRKLVRGIKGLL